jgi:hypothetical protein
MYVKRFYMLGDHKYHDLAPYMVAGLLGEYRLVSAVLHVGMLEGGHYTWVRFVAVAGAG